MGKCQIFFGLKSINSAETSFLIIGNLLIGESIEENECLAPIICQIVSVGTEVLKKLVLKNISVNVHLSKNKST